MGGEEPEPDSVEWELPLGRLREDRTGAGALSRVLSGHYDPQHMPAQQQRHATSDKEQVTQGRENEPHNFLYNLFNEQNL